MHTVNHPPQQPANYNIPVNNQDNRNRKAETAQADQNAADEFSSAMRKKDRDRTDADTKAGDKAGRSFTLDDKPLTNDNSRAAALDASPFTHDSRPLPDDNAPAAARDASPFMKDASPFTKDGQPLTNENARNAAKDSNPLPKGGNDLPKGGQKTEADASKERNPPAGMSPGDSILMGLHQGAARPENIQNVTPSAPIQTVAQTNGELLTRLADRILVSAPDAGGPREVRLMLREEVLPGTEIRIQRQPDGNVSVQFVTNDVRAEQLLGASQLNDLQSVLTRGLHVDVRVVTVRPDGGLTAEAGGQSDSGGGQNRGQHGGQGQPGDGRSRQHDIFEGLHEDNA